MKLDFFFKTLPANLHLPPRPSQPLPAPPRPSLPRPFPPQPSTSLLFMPLTASSGLSYKNMFCEEEKIIEIEQKQ